jgi:hypothetical protein
MFENSFECAYRCRLFGEREDAGDLRVGADRRGLGDHHRALLDLLVVRPIVAQLERLGHSGRLEGNENGNQQWGKRE